MQRARGRLNDSPGMDHEARGATAMKSLVEYIARSLVDDPVAVKVVANQRGRDVKLELTVSDEDMGRVIGRNGRVANAIRILLRVTSEREGTQVTLDVLEP